MKTSFFFILLGVLLQITLASYAQEKIIGGYNGCTKYQYKYKFGEPDLKSKTMIASYKYDKTGNINEEIIFETNGTFHSKYVYKYNEEGNRIEETIYNLDGSLSSKKTFKYNENGNIIESADYNLSTGSISVKNAYTYDNKGNLITESYYYDGSYMGKFVNNYNSDGKITEKISYGSQGQGDSKIVFKYDEKGNLVYEEGGPGYDIVTTMSELRYEDEPQTYFERYKYDDKHNKIEWIQYYSNDSIESKTNYKYDVNGKIIEEIKTHANVSIVYKFAYKYDALGNKTEEVFFDDINEPYMKVEYVYNY